MVKDMYSLNYLVNDHPNRETIFGSDSKWELSLPEEVAQRFKSNYLPNNMRRATENLVKVAGGMGYENIDGSSVNYNVDCHLYAPDQKQHIIMQASPYMLDGTTPKTRVALALKGLGALADGSKTVLLD